MLHSFAGFTSDGELPYAGVTKDGAGNLYGTTPGGGTNDYGTIFKIAPDGTETVLYSFAGGTDGANPYGTLISDSAGNLYGTTAFGGTHDDGTVFKLSTGGTESVLHSFAGESDGSLPMAGVAMDGAGNLYGTTEYGGYSGCNGHDCGTAFELAPDGTFTLLHKFIGGSGGGSPVGGLILDKSGNVYGTASQDGHTSGCLYCGAVFELQPNGAHILLYRFNDEADGGYPTGSLVMDKTGNLYGTTAVGGAKGQGTIFELTPDGAQTVLYSFCQQSGCTDGAVPLAGLIRDSQGNLYGTTQEGGGTNCGGLGCGTVFELAADGSETVLHVFTGKRDGAYPDAGLLADKAGHLFGTAQQGGADGYGVVFELKE